MIDSELVDKGDFESESEAPSRTYQPWRRLFARMIDYQISGLILTGLVLSTRLAPDFIINPVQVQNTPQLASSLAMGFFSMALWVVLEPLILSQFNNTPGKALLCLKLVRNNSSSSYWKRSFSVWAVGLGFGIPLISTFATIIAATRLKKQGIADWDRWYGFRVVADEFGFKRGLVALVLVALLVASNIVLMSDFEWFGEKNTNQVELNKDAASHKWDLLDNYSPTLSPNEKFEKLQKDAESGNVYAQYNLGVMYTNGAGVQKDNSKAFEWYQKAAIQGIADAQYNLGVMYTNGAGVPKNDSKAFYWYQKAAIQGDADAQFNLGYMYQFGQGVQKDDSKAVEWYQKAAIQGNATAQFNLGDTYQFGQGVQKDDSKAFEWYQKAAILGNAGAQYNLGVMYTNGAGVPKNDSKAFYWYQKAAIQGDADAQFKIGYIYGVGDGVTKNIVLAYAWSNLAAAQGNATAQSNRDIYAKQLSDIERMEGQLLASNWKLGDTLVSSSGAKVKETIPASQVTSQQSTGTAFIVSNEGHALTNHHVINGCAKVKVSGREGLVKVITSDSVNDLALLQLPGQIDSYAKLNPDTKKLRQGEDIVVFGYPLNFALSSGGNLTPGTLSAITGLGNNTNQIQITAPVQPGSSGSPVMDKKGNVIAVVSMTLDNGKITKITGQVGQNVNFAVNGQTVKAFLDANKVPYKTGGGFFSTEKNNADIADEARKWTVLVECWK